MTSLLVDNDVVIKLARYDLLGLLTAAGDVEVQVLGTARFVVASRLRKDAAALDRFLRFLPTVVELEPTEQEAQGAARILDTAIASSLPVDGGEGLLLVLMRRTAEATLLTGDKRAIAGAEALIPHHEEVATLAGRLRCLEQLMLAALQGLTAPLKSRVCAAAGVDRALAICFSCHSELDDPSEQARCLESYIEHARRSAPLLLAE